jgi:translation initiation factor 1 (eIF-1/SUI1)
MAKNSKGDDRSGESQRGPRGDVPAAGDAIARLERALAAETATSAGLRESLDALRSKVEQIEASFSQQLEDATKRSSTAEHKLADQQQRLAALGSGREETMRQLAETRAELARVAIERDELRKQLARVDGLQSSTIALTEEEQQEEPAIQPALPSIEELMASLGVIEEAGTRHDSGHLNALVTRDDDESQEMIAPELVFPEEFEEKNERPEADDDESAGRTSRVLVFLDAKQPIKYPLYKKVMTIGRAEDADIQVNGDFVSRVHARLVSTEAGVTIEDVASKNGIKINSKAIEKQARQVLRHGDVLGLGRLRFTFIDTAAVD